MRTLNLQAGSTSPRDGEKIELDLIFDHSLLNRIDELAEAARVAHACEIRAVLGDLAKATWRAQCDYDSEQWPPEPFEDADTVLKISLSDGGKAARVQLGREDGHAFWATHPTDIEHFAKAA